MPVNTIEDYKKGILEHYNHIKNDANHPLYRFLNTMTPGNIKSASQIVFETQNNEQDLRTISSYFKVSSDRDFSKLLSQESADSFISIKQFLNGKTKNPRDEVVEYAAWLVDFQARPYSLFREKGIISNPPEDEEEKPEPEDGDASIDPPSGPTGPPEPTPPSYKNLKIIISISVTALAAVMYLGFTHWLQKECMVWQGDRFVTATCYKDQNLNYVPFDQDRLQEFRQVTLDTTMTFFKNAKPLYWYDKSKGKVTFFNMQGQHPVNGKTLKPITQVIIRKYVFKEE